MAPSTTPKGRKDKSSSTLNEEKYKQIKRKLKDVLEENDRLGSRLKKMRTKTSQLKREKELLLDRLERYEHAPTSGSDTNSTPTSDSDSDLSSLTSDDDVQRPSGDLRFTNVKKEDIRAAHTPTIQVHPSSSLEPTPAKASAKRKKEVNKRPPVISKLRKIQHVPVDEAGKPILPLQVGIVTIYNLGEIVYDRKQFHSERYIYPVGYTITRPYASMVDADKTVNYTCTISDGGDGPRFHVTPEDAPDKAVTATTATGAWTAVIRVANALRKREHSNSASGPDYFGFSHPTVAKLIQDLPNVDKCENYVMQQFEEIKGRGTKRVNAKLEKNGQPSASPLAAPSTPSIGVPISSDALLPPTTMGLMETPASSPKVAISETGSHPGQLTYTSPSDKGDDVSHANMDLDEAVKPINDGISGLKQT